jgi:hypothetical protein
VFMGLARTKGIAQNNAKAYGGAEPRLTSGGEAAAGMPNSFLCKLTRSKSDR